MERVKGKQHHGGRDLEAASGCFSSPSSLGPFFQQLYNTVDTIVVGQYVGTQALAAVGAPPARLINLLVGFFVGLSSGATVIISQRYGARDARRRQSKAVHTAMALALVGGADHHGPGPGHRPGPCLRLLGMPARMILRDALTYAVGLLLPASSPAMIYNVGTGVLRAIGDAKAPPVCARLSAAWPISCWTCCLWWDSGWGVLGVACATVLSQVVSAAAGPAAADAHPGMSNRVVAEADPL